MPVRLCRDPTCANVATSGRYCAAHARQYERGVRRPGYHIYRSLRWQTTRERQLFHHPLCKCGALAEHVHHIRDIGDGGDPWDSSNLQSICASCHGKITRARQSAATI